MPELSRFLGIIIAMFYKDHSPPHFHAKYGEYEMNYPAASHGVSKARQQHEMNHPAVSCGATISKQASGYGPAGQLLLT